MVLMSVEPGCTCWNGLAEFTCLKGILLDSHMPKRVSLIPALLRQARSQTYRFADGVQSFFGTGRVTRGIDVEERYCFLPGEPLGKGSFGEVRAAMDKYTRERNAVKCATAKGSHQEKEAMLESFVQEAQVHLKLDHPNITKLLHVYVNEGSCHLVMELCGGGELYDRWYDRGVFTEDEAIIAVRQMLRALTYLHWHNVCHRDLKLENWVYKDHSDLSLKLIDFGFAKAFTEDTPMTATLGTIYYIAPEVIKGSYNQKCDIWSCGIILYMLLAGEPPYYDTHCDDWTMQKILHEPLDVNGEAWDTISPECKDFVCLALDRDANRRPSAKDLSKHSWLSDGDWSPSADISKKVLQDLRDFASMNVIKRAAFGLIAISMAGTDDLRDLEVEFRKLDREGSGTILKSQLADAFVKQLSMTETEAQALFKKLDLSGDEEIEYSEFIAAANGSRYMCNEALIKQAFQSLDVDGSGAISIENLRQVFGDKFNGTTVEEILAQVDKDGNGSISYEEFVQAIMELRPDEHCGDCAPQDLKKRISHAYEFTSVGRRHRGQGQKKNFQKAGIVYKASQHFQRARASHGQPPTLGRGWHTPDISRHCSREFSLDNAQYADSSEHRGLRPPTLNRGWHTPDISRHPSRNFSVEQL